MTLEEFAALVDRHDLTYKYSDDHRNYMSGSESLRQITEAAKQFPFAEVARIWNAKVDRSLLPGYREGWYWGDHA